MARWNTHAVFAGTDSKAGLLKNISVPDDALKGLRDARELIRTTLRQALPNWAQHLDKGVLFEDAVLPNVPSVTRPKFRSQGSMAYYTINMPAHEPPQEVDADDGMFLPVSFLEQDGQITPSLASQGLFTLVETALLSVCKENDWDLDRSKPSCVRVDLKTGAHVDVALYAIPDDEFKVLMEKAIALDSARGVYADAAVALNEQQIELSELSYQQLPQDHIVLAHRVEGWIASDPRKLEDWFQDAIKKHDYQLRRVCRYIKSWRDYTWKESKLSSIALMKCIVDIYDEHEGKFEDSRDDLALLKVLNALPAKIRAQIKNPVIDAYLDGNWTPEQRTEYAEAAKKFADNLQNAISAGTAVEVLQALRSDLGTRVPSDESLVREDDSPTPDPGAKSSGVLSSGLFKNSDSPPAVRKAGGDRYA